MWFVCSKIRTLQVKRDQMKSMLQSSCLGRSIVAVFVSALLAACSTTQPYESTAPRQVPLPDSMVALAPGAGAQLSVVETVYVNAIEQKISLDTRTKSPGQNYIKVQFFKTLATGSTRGGLQDVPLANMDMAGEARGTVNYADMKLSPYFVQNSYGPFGYSMGRTSGGDICMYAWQRIPPPRPTTSIAAEGWKSVNLRALICAAGQTEQQLLDVMLGLRLKGVAGAGTPSPEDIGAYGMVISPFASGPADILPEQPKPAPAAPSRPAAVTTPVPAADPPGPVPAPGGGGTMVPAPSGGGSISGPANVPVPIVPAPN